jgi:hypothetical protein
MTEDHAMERDRQWIRDEELERKRRMIEERFRQREESDRLADALRDSLVETEKGGGDE